MPKSETSLKKLLHEIRRISEHREVLTEKKIKAIYKNLEKELTNFLGETYIKYSDKDGRLFMSYLDAQNKRAKFLEEIVEHCNTISKPLKKELMSLVDETYSKCYEGMAEAVKKAEKAGKLAEIAEDLAVQPDVLKQAVNNNISKLTLSSVMEKHRQEIVYQAQQALVMGLINGDRYEQMSRRIVERTGVSRSKANNIARTETHRNVESGFMDCAENLSEKMQGSEYIYAATWQTMQDERVRPQARRKTKSGWKTYYNKNGADHMKMQGVTVEVGDLFNLGGGVKAKAPSQSGVAAHDCNCRCYLEYNLMTEAEFVKATGKPIDYAGRHYKRAVKKEPTITNDVQAAANAAGSELSGLDFRLKTESSYTRKVGKEISDLQKKVDKAGIKYTVTQQDAVSNMRDVVRYTSLSSKENLVNDYNTFMNAMSEKGYSVVRVKNTFKKDAPYKGINTIIHDKNGFEFEVQFHTPQSFELKNGILHELYEEERLVTTTAARKLDLQKQMKEISDSIIFPDNVDSIESFDELTDILDKLSK